MAEGADERLIVMLEARIAEFEKRMSRAERSGTGSYNRLRNGSRSATRQMEADMVRSTGRINQALATTGTKIGAFGKAFAGGLIGGAVATGVAMLTTELNMTVKAIAQIGDEAKRAGLGVEAFQEWKYVADQNRIGLDAVVDGFKELNLRADEWITTGGGSAAEAFQRLGFSAAELKKQLEDPSALMLEIIGRMEGLDKAAQIRIADELFGGTGGERFVELLDKGEKGITAQIDRARELGIVMDSDMIAKAADLDAKFSEVTARMRGIWQAGVVEAALYFGLIEDEMNRMSPEQIIADNTETEMEAMAASAGNLVLMLSDLSSALRGMGHEAEAVSLTALATSISDATAEWNNGITTGEEYRAKLQNIGDEARIALQEMSDLNAVTMSGVIGEISSLLEWIGLIPGAAAAARAEVIALSGLDMSGSFSPDLNRFGNPYQDPDAVMDESPRPQRPGVDSLGDWEAARTPTTRGGGGGGSSRLESLVEELRSEEELLSEWYERSLEMLNGATEAQLEALGGKHEAIERLEREHKDRLAEIDQMTNASRLNEMGSFFGSLADLTAAGGDKLVRAARVFGAAEALINTYVAQSQVLRDPTLGFWGKLAAYGAIGAAGLGLVSAIKGGGGGGRGGGRGATTAEPTQSSQGPVNVSLQGINPASLYSGQTLIDMTTAIQKELKTRGVIFHYV